VCVRDLDGTGITPQVLGTGFSHFPPHRRLVKRCNKPDRREFLKVARLTALGFLATGVIGFVVKVIFIPVRGPVRLTCSYT